MSTTKGRRSSKTRYERAIFSLPPDLMAEARQFAGAFHQGNNSGFVAAAIRSYIDLLRKSRHTAKLRESYAAAADAARHVGAEWDQASDDLWAKLDDVARRGKK